MRAGTPLTDEDRVPWLSQLAAIVQEHCAAGQPAVLSCSALKPAYRRVLQGEQPLVTAAPGREIAESSSTVSGASSGGAAEQWAPPGGAAMAPHPDGGMLRGKAEGGPAPTAGVGFVSGAASRLFAASRRRCC